MTITINFLEIFRAIFILGWVLAAGIIAFGGIVYSFDRTDRIYTFLMCTLCFGSAVMLYLGR